MQAFGSRLQWRSLRERIKFGPGDDVIKSSSGAPSAMGLLTALVADLQALGAEAVKRKLPVVKEVRVLE